MKMINIWKGKGKLKRKVPLHQSLRLIRRSRKSEKDYMFFVIEMIVNQFGDG